MSSGAELVRELCALWAPPASVSVSQWADQHLFLSPEYSAYHGKFQSHRYQREPMNCCSDPLVRQVVVKGAVQMLKTIVGQAMIGWAIDTDPGPILVVNHREEDADAFAKERIDPMIRDTPRLSGKISQAGYRGKRRKSTLREKWFTGGMLACTFSTAPGNMARRAIRYLICEEEDKWPSSTGGRGSPFKMAQARMDTFGILARSFRSSSPSRPGSTIDKAYEESDQREYYVPCPHCQHEQSMMGKFRKQVRWDESLPTKEEQAKSARYHCEACDQPWDQRMLEAAVESGRWIAGKPFQGIAGFWISALYSPWKKLSDLVFEWLNVVGNPLEEMTFVNERLAENWVEKGEAPEWQAIHARAREYPVGTVPRGALFLTAGADVHPDRIECEVVGWGRNRESWSVDYRIFEGSTAQPEVWSKFWSFASDLWPTQGGALLPISRGFLDSGNQTAIVYDQVRRNGQGRFVAIKGSDGRKMLMPVSQPAAVDITIAGHRIKGGLKIRHVNGPYFKHELYQDLRKLPGNPGCCHFPQGQFYDEEHFRQLCAEQLVTRTLKTGRMVQEWEQLRPRNEALDCRVYARAAAYDLGMDRFQEHHWGRLEAQLQGEFELQPPPEPAAREAPPVVSEPPPVRPTVPMGPVLSQFAIRRPRLQVRLG